MTDKNRRKHKELILGAKLPIEPPTVEERPLAEQAAKHLRLKSGYYRDYEIAHLVSNLAMRELQIGLSDLIPLMLIETDLENTIAEILGYVRRHPGKLWTEDKDGNREFPFNEADIGHIWDCFGQIVVFTERLGGRPTEEGTRRANEVAEGIRLLLNHTDEDQGNALREAARTHTGSCSSVEAWLASIIPLGRPSEPTPVNKFILQETRRLAQLHRLKTRGETVKSFMEFLETHADVQHWKANPHPTPDRDTSVQLQAYIVFHDLDRPERRDKLREIEVNNPNFRD